MNQLNAGFEKNFEIRVMQADDLAEVRAIYLDGIATKNATFEVSAPETWQEWDAKYISQCRLVAANSQKILGWAMLSSISGRRCYSGVAEVSIYVAKVLQDRGIGYGLMSKLITDSEVNGFWTLQSGVFPENEASLALHYKCGFKMVGLREKIAMLDGKWRDMLLLERRSRQFL